METERTLTDIRREQLNDLLQAEAQKDVEQSANQAEIFFYEI